MYPYRASWARAPEFDPLDGAGGLKGPGRWHHLGTRITYTSCSPSLALLESLVHLVPHRYGEQTLIEIEVPDDKVESVSHGLLVQLLRDGNPAEPEAGTRRFGSEWVKAQRSLALRVPSIVMPFENNLLLNPSHPRCADVRVLRRELITLDVRLALEGVARADAGPAEP